MGKLNQIDKAADSKGSAITTIWQFVMNMEKVLI